VGSGSVGRKTLRIVYRRSECKTLRGDAPQPTNELQRSHVAGIGGLATCGQAGSPQESRGNAHGHTRSVRPSGRVAIVPVIVTSKYKRYSSTETNQRRMPMSKKYFDSLPLYRQELIRVADELCMRYGVTPILRKNQRNPNRLKVRQRPVFA
jgi:hypothetical protein